MKGHGLMKYINFAVKDIKALPGNFFNKSAEIYSLFDRKHIKQYA